MKKLLFSIVCAFALFSCGLSTSDVENEVLNLANSKLVGTGVVAKDVTLVKGEGNNYKGMITLSADGEEESYTINVVCDGENIMYEIPELN